MKEGRKEGSEGAKKKEYNFSFGKRVTPIVK